MKRLAILGAGGHGKVIADAALLSGWGDVVFFDDRWPNIKQNGVWSVEGNSLELRKNSAEFDGLSVAIGDNQTRIKRINELLAAGLSVVNIIHPAAIVSPYSTIGQGSVVFAGAIINPYTTIGIGCIINTAATIDHDCHLGDGVHLCPGVHLAGDVSVGAYSMLGIGSSVKNQVQIGSNVLIGAGAAVINHIESNITAVGVPARARNESSC